MGALLTNSAHFDPARRRETLAALPAAAGVFALCAEDPAAEPYLGKTPDLRRRLNRLLKVEEGSAPGKRLRLAKLTARVEYAVTGSEFESAFCLYQASLKAFGDGARRRLRLRPPVLLRMAAENPFPRLYITSRICRKAVDSIFGPFASRAAAETYAEEVLNLFQLRRCTQDLHPDPSFPGCIYSEMKMCLAPCFAGCTDERYRQEAEAVQSFLATRGEALIGELERERGVASEALAFEQAAAIHRRITRVKAAAHSAGEAVRPLSRLHGAVVQAAAAPASVALFGLRGGYLTGPEIYSTEGLRHPNERSGSSSFYAHPVALTPLKEAPASRDLPESSPPESRLEDALRRLWPPGPAPASAPALADHLAFFARWYYRPAERREGEIVFANGDGAVNRKALLRAISRVSVAASVAAMERRSIHASAAPANFPE